jgi:dCMP deaminase
MSLATDTAARTTCIRAGVGCVLADVRGKVLSTGYNGPPRGLPHCNELASCRRGKFTDQEYVNKCPGADAQLFPDGCEAVHAEINALMWCADVERVHTCHVTTEPCFRCAKALLNTGCTRVLYLRANGDGGAAFELWRKAKGSSPDLDLSQTVDMRFGWELVGKRTESC